MSADSRSFSCRQCSFRSLSWRELARHRFETHSNEPSFLEKCAVLGCSQTFRRYSSFLSHLSRKHRGVDVESAARSSLLTYDAAGLETEDRRVRIVTADRITDATDSADYLSEGIRSYNLGI